LTKPCNTSLTSTKLGATGAGHYLIRKIEKKHLYFEKPPYQPDFHDAWYYQEKR
jgi:hypothetical protein